MDPASTFREFFALATDPSGQGSVAEGYAPYVYQQAIATQGLPDLLQVPTGAGKTEAAVLPWLFRLLQHPDRAVRAETPRRLVFALPMRTLVHQTERRVRDYLANLGFEERVAVHVVMGGELSPTAQQAWRVDMHKPSIVIGTIDCIVSRALNRGYGAFRASYPLDFALVTNGAQIVVDEIQLGAQATATMRQVLGFIQRWGTAEPTHLTCMSATVDPRILDVIDNPYSPDRAAVLSLSDADHTGHLRRRLEATRTIKREKASDPAAVAARVAEAHEAGTRTLVVLNTVSSAVATYKKLGKLKPDANVVLVHSRFRGLERDELSGLVTAEVPEKGRIIVATQVIEAGVDVDAKHLFTELPPWSSLCQRAGRCNRAGTFEESSLHWFDPLAPPARQPYEEHDLAESRRILESLEETPVTSRGLLEVFEQSVVRGDLPLRIIRHRDFQALFDTTPDLAGNDIDIAPYIRESESLDVQVAWIDHDGVSEGALVSRVPSQAERCTVPPAELVRLVRRDGVRAWTFNAHEDRWTRRSAGARTRPNELVLVDRDSGGYDPTLGFDPQSTTTVWVPEPEAAHFPEGQGSSADPGAVDQPEWITLTRHGEETRDQARALVRSLRPGLEQDDLVAAVVAAHVHDVGKAHPDWQAALRATAPDSPDAPPDAELLAKSPGGGRLRVLDGETNRPRGPFRHELVSALMVGSEGAAGCLEALGLPAHRLDLCRYLVAAHHGHVRLQPRDPITEGSTGQTLLGLRSGEALPQFTPDGMDAGTVGGGPVDLDEFSAGSASWSRLAQKLLTRLGPFRLAYLETLVRMADWRSSGQYPLPEEESP